MKQKEKTVYLVAVHITKGNTDLISGVRHRGTACLNDHRVRTHTRILIYLFFGAKMHKENESIDHQL